MINHIRLLRNIGQFENVTAANLAFQPLTLIYAENGRGKTTLSAAFRSLATGNPEPILERHRLAATHAPEAIVECTGGPPPAIFRNGSWNRHLPDILVFDDVFVDDNVYSGLSVDSAHRQNLHDLIVGAQGVALNQHLQTLVGQIEAHNVELRTRAARIPAAVLNGMSIEEFCAVQRRQTIDADILEAERAFEAALQQQPIRDAPSLESLALPGFDIQVVETLLSEGIDELDAAAASRVQEHLERLPRNSEQWINDGLSKPILGEHDSQVCPFCAQDMAASPVLVHYRAFFGEEYRNLKRRVEQFASSFRQSHSEQALLGFERALRTNQERRAFWLQFAEIPDVATNTAALLPLWQQARELTFTALAAKQAAPLEKHRLSDVAQQAIEAYIALRSEVLALNANVAEANRRVMLVKERSAAGNVETRRSDLSCLQTIRSRFEPGIVQLCDAYLAEKKAKTVTEQGRNRARDQLAEYRRTVFPDYGTAINQYLARFSAGFRISQVETVNTRGGPACNYTLRINNVDVPVGADPGNGRPSFRNTLSAGDRNTLALALFFAALDADPALANKIIVIDDPVSSLDDNRTRSTVHEIHGLVARVGQVVVLSHSKTFLCQTWDGCDKSRTAAFQVRRDGASTSVLDAWNVNTDMVTSHDRRHHALRNYVDSGHQGNLRDIAVEVRPTLEYFCRVAFPAEFRPDELLGTFRTRCLNRRQLGTPIMNPTVLAELERLVDYGNQFHHDTNPNDYLNVAVTDVELRGFVERTLTFCTK